jgi:hypothetical protein
LIRNDQYAANASIFPLLFPYRYWAAAAFIALASADAVPAGTAPGQPDSSGGRHAMSTDKV